MPCESHLDGFPNMFKSGFFVVIFGMYVRGLLLPLEPLNANTNVVNISQMRDYKKDSLAP